MKTVKMNINSLMPPALNWAVSTCEGIEWEQGDLYAREYGPGFKPSTEWAQGGPIIEREGMQLQLEDIAEWHATIWWDDEDGQREIVTRGPTPLIAAMRCYVASKLGDEVEIPDQIGASHELVD